MQEQTEAIAGTSATQFARLLSKQELALVALASQDASRYNMNGLHLDPSGLLIATNGHVLGTLRVNAVHQPEDFPMRAGLANSWPIPKQGITIPAHAIKAALDAMPKKPNVAVQAHAALWIGHERAALHTTTLDGWGEHGWRIEDTGTYPDWRRVWGTTEGEQTDLITMSAGYLGLIEDTARACVYTGANRRTMREQTNTVTFRLHGADKALEFSARNADAELRGLLMPCRVSENHPPVWGVPS